MAVIGFHLEQVRINFSDFVTSFENDVSVMEIFFWPNSRKYAYKKKKKRGFLMNLKQSPLNSALSCYKEVRDGVRQFQGVFSYFARMSVGVGWAWIRRTPTSKTIALIPFLTYSTAEVCLFAHFRVGPRISDHHSFLWINHHFLADSKNAFWVGLRLESLVPI